MAKAEDQVQELHDKERERQENLRFWHELGKTDPAHTKGFNRSGGFSGTAVKPMWINKRLTEVFGPCGVGWGVDKPEFQVVHAQDGEVLVYCTVMGWYFPPDSPIHRRGEVFGVGGDKVSTLRSSGKMFHDDEAFKKAYTDALNNAFKFIGVAADVHMGLFDDSKYVDEMRAEFSEPDPLDAKADALETRVKAAADVAALTTLLNSEETKELMKLFEAQRKGKFTYLRSLMSRRMKELKGTGE